MVYLPTAKNIARILEYHTAWSGVLAHDVRGSRVVLRKPPPEVAHQQRRYPCELVDTDETAVSIWLEGSRFAILVGPGSPALRAGINIAAQRDSFDPVIDYLRSLAWDGCPRIGRLCTDYFGSEDTPLNAAFGAKWMISAVARAFAPGCKADHLLTLEGDQGIGKSLGLCTLAGADFFGDNLPSVSTKDAMVYLQGPWIVEVAELDAFSRANASTVKSFLSRCDDRFRPPYGGRAVSHPRRSVFAATTNEPTFLSDTTGSRRCWPVSVRRVDVAAIELDRDQLWAEAVHRYCAGEPWHLVEADLVDAARDEQERRAQVDPWSEPVGGYLATLQPHQLTSVQDILARVLRIEVGRRTRSDEMRVAEILQTAGYRRRQKGTGKSRTYQYGKAITPAEQTPTSSSADDESAGCKMTSDALLGRLDGDVGVCSADAASTEDEHV